MNKPHLVVLLLLLFCNSIYAQKTLPVIASTDKSKVLLGEQFDLVFLYFNLIFNFREVKNAG